VITSVYEILSIHLHVHRSYSVLARFGIILHTGKAGTDNGRLSPRHIGHMLHANYSIVRHFFGADAVWSSMLHFEHLILAADLQSI